MTPAQADATARLLRALSLLACAPPAALTRRLGAPRLTVGWVEAVRPADLPLESDWVAFELELGARRRARILVEPGIGRILARGALGLPLDELDAPRPLAPAEVGALRLVITAFAGETIVAVEPVAAVGPVVPGHVGPRAWLEAQGGDAWCGVADLVIEALGRRGRARLVLPAAELASARTVSRRPCPAPARLLAALGGSRCELRVEVASAGLAASAIDRLAIDDVVLLPTPGPRPGGSRELRARLRMGRGAFPARLSEEGVELDGPFEITLDVQVPPSQGSEPMSAESHSPEPETSSPPADRANAALLEELLVELTCEIGRVRMSVAEVARLEAGAVIALDRPLQGAVDLLAGERLVARGELVDMEGRLGVRVRELVR